MTHTAPYVQWKR